jgi:cellulose synthase (UDP-forming)
MSIYHDIKEWISDLRGKKEYRRYLEKETRRRRITGQVFAFLNFPCAIYYIGWCIKNANWDCWYAFIPFIASEVFFLVHYFLWVHLLWYKRHHRPEGPQPSVEHAVDVFITVCREPVAILRSTVAAAVRIDYPAKNVCILDDGEDDAVRALAEEFQVRYLRRTTHEFRKAGNLNQGLAQTSGDLILTLDADQIAEPEIIRSIVGYFNYPKVAFVQTAQRFNLPKNDPWGNSDAVFYKAMQSGKDFDNSAISCGNGVMYRRAALESIGGFATWNLVEDLQTSMHLHNKGWKSIYHDTPLTSGHAPVDVISNLKQRWQWAVDSLRLFFWDNPLRHKGLSWNQRLQYLHFGYNYVSFGIFLPIFFTLPIWALFSGKFMLTAPMWKYALARLPYFLVYLVANKALTDRLNNFKVFQCQAALFPVYFSATFTALRCRNHLPKYTVTSKTELDNDLGLRIRKSLPHLSFILMSLAAVVYGVCTVHDDLWFLLVNIFWCLWTVSALTRFILLSFCPKVLMR